MQLSKTLNIEMTCTWFYYILLKIEIYLGQCNRNYYKLKMSMQLWIIWFDFIYKPIMTLFVLSY